MLTPWLFQVTVMVEKMTPKNPKELFRQRNIATGNWSSAQYVPRT